MAGEVFVAVEGGRARDYGGGVTFSVAVTSLMAASCGLIFGYDIGVSGGVTQMDSFLKKFFPEVLRGMKSAKRDAYCKYDNQQLTAFTSSMYIAGMAAALVASSVTRRVGRKTVMLIGGVLFLAGSIINAGAVNIAMLIIGRILLGFGVGFTAQAAPLYLAETSPARWRGGFTTAYHFFLVAGTLVANVANYFTNRIPDWGWRVSLGLAAVPATFIVTGALFVSDTPSSLVLRGDPDGARASLQRIRGGGADAAAVEAEFKDIVRAAEAARRDEEGAFARLLRGGRGYRHYQVMMVAIPAFFDLTGMVVISVFSPVVFRTVGFSSQRAILGAVIISVVSLCGVALSTLAVDRCGRRFLFLAGGSAMLLFLVAVAWVLAEHLRNAASATAATTTMPRDYGVVVVVLVCLYTLSFSVSWGPLKWVVPSEIYPVEIRSAGQAITLAVALTLSFTQTQVFISMLCAMKYAIFLFYAGWVLAMTVFIAAFLPETKGVPLETMRSVWAGHWFWKKFVVDVDVDVDAKQEVQVSRM